LTELSSQGTDLPCDFFEIFSVLPVKIRGPVGAVILTEETPATILAFSEASNEQGAKVTLQLVEPLGFNWLAHRMNIARECSDCRYSHQAWFAKA
jgi:hypothetical protein